VSHSAIGLIYLSIADPGAALASFEEALALRSALDEANPGEVRAQRDLALAHENLGRAHIALARKATDDRDGRPPGANPAIALSWGTARAAFEHSRDLWLALRDQGTLPPSDAKQPEAMAAEAERCAAAFESMRPPS
jgi:hypothetical protein